MFNISYLSGFWWLVGYVGVVFISARIMGKIAKRYEEVERREWEPTDEEVEEILQRMEYGEGLWR